MVNKVTYVGCRGRSPQSPPFGSAPGCNQQDMHRQPLVGCSRNIAAPT